MGIVEDIFMLIITLMLTIIIVFLLVKMRGKKMFVLAMIIGMIVIAFSWAYTMSIPFRQEVNMLFHSESQHVYRIEHAAYHIPLPPNTIFSYRTSSTAAMYFTRTSKDGIIKFFDDLSQSPIIILEPEDSLSGFSFHATLLLYYEQQNFIVKIKPSLRQGRWEIYIDVNKPRENMFFGL